MRFFSRLIFVFLCLIDTVACIEYKPNSASEKRAVGTTYQASTSADASPVVSGSSAAGSNEVAIDADDASFSLFKDCKDATDRKFVADLVKISEETTKLPVFSDLRPYGQVCLENLNISPRPFEEGFPGYPGLLTFFALDIKFKLQIAQGGEFLFSSNSARGSKFLIDNVVVIDNDGNHAALFKEGKIVLSPGIHTAEVEYFQTEGEIALELQWQKPGDVAFGNIPLNYVQRP